MRTTSRAAAVAGLVAAAVLATSGTAVASPDDLATARAATARFHRVDAAGDAEYGLFKDKNEIACIDQPGVGGMGVHYVNGGLVGDVNEDPATPEALVYEPTADGLRLVAVEYVVLRSAWDAEHDAPPSLFGQEFELVPAGNRYDLPDFYELHVWLWRHNPSGLFEDWNPAVSCP